MKRRKHSAYIVLIIIMTLSTLVSCLRNSSKYNGPSSEIDLIIQYDYFYKDNRFIETKEYLMLFKNQPLESKISIILRYLENTVFDKNIIDFHLDLSKERLTINFLDAEASSIFSSKWNNYFQGSSGASYTYNMLINNLIQPEKSEAWINEIEFKYNGKQFPAMDHVNLSEVVNRGKM